MKYFATLPVKTHHINCCKSTKSLAVTTGLAVVFLFAASVQAQTLVDTIEIPARNSVVSGVPISGDSDFYDTNAANVENSFDGRLDVVEREFGTKIIREYRDRGRLVYVEILQADNRPSYVYDSTTGEQPERQRNRSGVVITSW